MPPRKAKATPTMTSAAIRKLVKDSIAEALVTERAAVAAAAAEAAAAAAVENARPADVAAAGVAEGSRTRKCRWNDFKNGDPTKFKGTEGATAMIRWFEHTESVFHLCNCPEENKVKFATNTLIDEAMSWWNSYARPMGMENAYKLTWNEFKKLLTKKFCPRTEIKKMETEFYELVTVGNDIETYIRRYQELAALCPSMVPDNEKLLENFTGGLPQNIRGDVISSDPQTIDEAIRMSQKLMAQILKEETTDNNNNHNNNDNKRSLDNNQSGNATKPQPKRQEVAKVYAAGSVEKRGYHGTLPKCNKCQNHHNPGPCLNPCGNCKKIGHATRECQFPNITRNQKPSVTCFGCGEIGHYRNKCPKQGNQRNGNQGRRTRGRT
jgi:hypothetical protein